MQQVKKSVGELEMLRRLWAVAFSPHLDLGCSGLCAEFQGCTKRHNLTVKDIPFVKDLDDILLHEICRVHNRLEIKSKHGCVPVLNLFGANCPVADLQ
jgi:hypothetical protein